jgi:hypothetical protein
MPTQQISTNKHNGFGLSVSRRCGRDQLSAYYARMWNGGGSIPRARKYTYP